MTQEKVHFLLHEKGTGQLLSPAKCFLMLGQYVRDADAATVVSVLDV